MTLSRSIVAGVVGVSVVTLAASRANAQSAWSAEAGVGLTAVQGGTYTDREALVGWRWEIDRTIARRDRVDGYGGVVRMAPVDAAAPIAIGCPVEQPCPDAPPAIQVTGALAGVRGHLLPRVDLNVAAGAGVASERSLGIHGAFVADASAAVHVAGWVWLVGGTGVLATAGGGNPLSAAPWYIGLRLH